MEEMASGRRPPEHFNDCRLAFLPKGDEPSDLVDCTRSPECTRPLTLKNSDSKGVAAAVNLYLAGVVARDTHGVQKGFVAGRKFGEHIVALDAE
eukprot:3534130-Pyramimonas_sp.AAC.1